jgi:hypothetical protein
VSTVRDPLFPKLRPPIDVEHAAVTPRDPLPRTRDCRLAGGAP